MKIEICENTFRVLICAVICAAVIALVAILVHGVNTQYQNAFTAGYQEVALPGQMSTAWQKTK